MQNIRCFHPVRELPPEALTPIDHPQRTRNLTLLCSCIGFAMIILDANIITVALPSISHALGGGSRALLWFINIYALIYAALLLTGGVLADRLGAKPVFLVGLLLFTLASLAGSFVPNIEILTFTRGLQALGAALLTPGSLALITHSYRDDKERARAVSIYSAVSGIGLIGGPILGGLLIDAFGWWSVFLLNVPIRNSRLFF